MENPTSSQLRIATRQSQLALWQANFVRQELLKYYPQLEINLIPILTEGDQLKGKLVQWGGKALFVKELQNSLLKGEADIAVHSVKDLSVTEHAELALGAICFREDPRDVLISASGLQLNELPKHAVVGTTSPRRQSQLLAFRSDLIIKPLRGNVETRLQKLKTDEYDAIILAAAGLNRLKFNNLITEHLNPLSFVPTIGQREIGIEYVKENRGIQELIQILNHPLTSHCVKAERTVNKILGGDCMTPIGVYSLADSNSNELRLYGMIGSMDGKLIIRCQVSGNMLESEDLGCQLAEKMLAEGASYLIKDRQRN